MSRPAVLLFGLGGIGGIYACILYLSGKCDVHVVARSNYQAVKEKGYRINSKLFGNRDDIRFAGVWKSCEEAAKSGVQFSYVLCANKSLLSAVPSLSDQLRPIIGPNTSIVLLQNGVGGEAPLHASFPNNTIISAVVWTGGKGAEEVNGQAGVDHFGDKEKLTIGVDYREGGDKKEEDEKLAEIVGFLRAGGGTCDVVESIQNERWIKVIWNCCWNSITAVVRMRTGPFFDSSEFALPLCYTVMEEVAAVARAKGYTIPDDKVESLIQQCLAHGKAGIPSSMMFDNLAGRPMEVEAILGTPLRDGLKLKVPVPTLLTLYTLVKALDYGNEHSEVKVDGQ